MFRALAFVLYGNEMCHEKVIELLVQFVSQNRDSFRPYIDGYFERYLSNMRHTRVWGTAVVILATASLLQIPVFRTCSGGPLYKHRSHDSSVALAVLLIKKQAEYTRSVILEVFINKFKRKPVRRGQPFYKGQLTCPQCVLCSEVLP